MSADHRAAAADPAATGAEPVGRLADAAPAARLFVRTLRLWLTAPQGRAEAWNGLATDLGAARGRDALAAFERFIDVLVDGAAGPIWRHRDGCVCVGRDEAALAGAVIAAGAGDFAMAHALLAPLLHPDAVAPAIGAAGRLGAAFVVGDTNRSGYRDGDGSHAAPPARYWLH